VLTKARTQYCFFISIVNLIQPLRTRPVQNMSVSPTWRTLDTDSVFMLGKEKVALRGKEMLGKSVSVWTLVGIMYLSKQ
jgi:hypothetical protein